MRVALRALSAPFALAVLVAHGTAPIHSAAEPTAPPAEALRGELAYAALTDGVWQLWLRDLARGTARPLTSGSEDLRAPRWGAGGTLYARTPRQELWQVAPGSPPVPWHPELWPARDPHWVAGAPGVVLARLRTHALDYSDLVVVDDTAAPPEVWLRGERRLRIHPLWSPDGRSLVYVRSLGFAGSELRRLSFPTGVAGAETILLAGAGHVLHPAWSPDGSRIAFSGSEDGDFDLWVLELATGQRRRVAAAPGFDSHPAWSPDGAWLAFTTRRRGQLEIWVAEASAGGEAWPLVAGPRPVQEPAWR